MRKKFEIDTRVIKTGKSYPFGQGLFIHHLERLREMRVDQQASTVKIKGKDLRELLFLMDKVDVSVSSSLLYQILVTKKVIVPGFNPNKTILRQMGLSLAEVNSILPGSFPSAETEIEDNE